MPEGAGAAPAVLPADLSLVNVFPYALNMSLEAEFPLLPDRACRARETNPFRSCMSDAVE